MPQPTEGAPAEPLPIHELEQDLVERLNHHPIRDLDSEAELSEIKAMFKVHLPGWNFSVDNLSGNRYNVPYDPEVNVLNLYRYIIKGEGHHPVHRPFPEPEFEALEDSIAKIWTPFSDVEDATRADQIEFDLICGKNVLRLHAFTKEPPSARIVIPTYQIEGILQQAGVAKMEIPT